MTKGTHPSRSAPVASFLSFLWPGLGQAWQGRRRSAMLWAAPPLILAALVLGAALGGLPAFAADLLTPTSALTTAGLLVLLVFWRSLSIIDATARSGRRPTAGTVGVLVVLIALVVATNGMPAYYAWSVYDAGSRIFVAQPNDGAIPSAGPEASFDPNDPNANNADEFVATPEETPATENDRINVLITGIDSGPGRAHALTDTLLVASLDPTTGEVAFVSFPRDISNFPLWDGRTFSGKINSLMAYAKRNPDEFPDGGFQTLIKELGFLLGVPIHYYAAIDLNGFVRMIDLVGGVTVDNQRAISDARYDWLDGKRGFYLSAGKHKLDGRTALAYARSRQGVGDTDYTRAARQQEILLALRQKLTRPENIEKIPELLDAAGDSIRTNFPQERVGEMAALVQDIDADQIRQVVLGPPFSYHPPTTETGGVWTLRLRMKQLAELSVELFGEDSRYYEQAQ